MAACRAATAAARAAGAVVVLREAAVALDRVAVRVQSRPIWSDATFTVRRGTFAAVVGPNGAGKTTLLRLLLGHTAPAGGTVQVLGVPPRRGNPAIGYVPQRRVLDPETPVRGRDLVTLGIDGHRWGMRLGGRERHQRAVDAALDQVRATAIADRPIGRLSGGEQQRLFLAQALASQPSLLLLDEPLASLDVRNQVAIAQLVDRAVRDHGVTALMVTHDINPILGVIDQVVYIAQGKVLAGDPREVVTTETLSSIYGGQVEVLRDSHGHVFVVGLDQEVAHPHDR